MRCVNFLFHMSCKWVHMDIPHHMCEVSFLLMEIWELGAEPGTCPQATDKRYYCHCDRFSVYLRSLKLKTWVCQFNLVVQMNDQKSHYFPLTSRQYYYYYWFCPYLEQRSVLIWNYSQITVVFGFNTKVKCSQIHANTLYIWTLFIFSLRVCDKHLILLRNYLWRRQRACACQPL